MAHRRHVRAAHRRTRCSGSKSLILPWIALAFLFAALYARLTRANMLETMGEDYIRTARAKGLPRRTVVLKHGLRAALTPIVTIFGLDLGALLGGAVITEHGLQPARAWAGCRSRRSASRTCRSSWASRSSRPLVLVIANLVVDILYAVVDPRVSYS